MYTQALITILANSSRLSNESRNTTEPYSPVNTKADIIVYAFYGAIFLCGVFGNILVVLTITRCERSKSLKHCFLLNLAITDLLTLIVVLPLSITGKHISWKLGTFVCKYIFPLTDVVIAVSVLTHVSISLDRYRTIIYPMAAKPTHFQRLLILIAIWVISYLLNGLPLSLVLNVGKGYWVLKACVPSWSSRRMRQVYYLQRLAVIFLIPIVVNLISYLRISKALAVSLILLQGSARGKKRETLIRRQRRLIRMFLTIFVAFVVCFFPIHLLSMLEEYSQEFKTWKGGGHVFQVAFVFAYGNSMCNPIILVIMSSEYRRTFYNCLPILKCQTCPFMSADNQEQPYKGDDVNLTTHNAVSSLVDFLPTSKVSSSLRMRRNSAEMFASGESYECEAYGLGENHLSTVVPNEQQVTVFQ